MRVSELYNLGADQSGLDFVDVDTTTDVPVYIDPSSIRNQHGAWAEACQADLQSFFSELLRAISADDKSNIKTLVYPLIEPNETHLGTSQDKSKGRGLGREKNSDNLVKALSGSKAAASGLLQDLEDTVLFIPNIGIDIVSDMTTCIIRGQLIEYTQRICTHYSIPMVEQLSGEVWNSNTCEWEMSDYVLLPRVDNLPLLLVPRAIVRVKPSVDRGEYYVGYLRPYYEREELNDPRSNLVKVLKNKTLKVEKGKLNKKLGTTKPDIVKNSAKYPQALAEYKKYLRASGKPPLSSHELNRVIGTPVVDYDELHGEVLSIAPGKEGATLYHRSVQKLFNALFETSLGNGRPEEKLHDGLKRVDIVYDNVAENGFFSWLAKHHRAATIVVECKNYSKEITNPEVDQLAGRFSDLRGQVGILACRKPANKDKLLDRCRTTTIDRRGFILLVDDEDLKVLVAEAKTYDPESLTPMPNSFALLRQRFDALIN